MQKKRRINIYLRSRFDGRLRGIMEQDRPSVYPYYNRPDRSIDGNVPPDGSRPQPLPPNGFARAAKVLGIIALVSVFTFTVYPPLIFGALAIILALLSRGSSLKMHPSAKTGAQTAAIAFGVDITLVAACFMLIFGNPVFFEDFNKTYEEIYGMTFQEMMEGIQNGTLDYDDIYENVYENMYDSIYEDIEDMYPDIY